MRRIVAAAVLGVVPVAAVAVATVGTPAAADVPVSITEVGWWSDWPGASEQAERGFQVADGGPAGASSVGAIRVAVMGTLTEAHLTLVQSDGAPTVRGVQACVTTAPWTAANPGPIDQAPTADCATPAVFTATPTPGDATIWDADVLPLLSSAAPGTDVSLMVVAVPASGPVSVPMQVTFNSSGLQANGTLAPSSTASPTTSGTTTPHTTPSLGGIVPSFHPPAPVAQAAVVTTTTAAPPTTEAASGPSIQPLRASHSGKGKPWGRLLLVLPAAGAFGFGAAHGRRYLDAWGPQASST